MKIAEVDSRIQDFCEGGQSKEEILTKNVSSLLFSHGQNVYCQKGLHLDRKRVLREINGKCPACKSSNIVKNGYHERESFILQEIGAQLLFGQYLCNSCRHRWSIDSSDILTIIKGIKEEVQKVAAQIRTAKVSLGRTGLLLKALVGKTYSHTTVRRWCIRIFRGMQEPTPLEYSGYYVYDEQRVCAGNKTMQRLTLRDVTIPQPIAEEITNDKSQETIRAFLVKSLRNKPCIAMTVDGDHSYPFVIEHVLKMKYQLDIGHLFDNIKKAFKDKCAYGVHPKRIHILDELKKQELYDVLFPRQQLLKFVQDSAITLSSITNATDREDMDKAFQETLRELKRERKKARRRKGHIHEHKGYTLEMACQKFDRVKHLMHTYPKKVQQIIQRMDEDWEHYTLFLVDGNVPAMSNGSEQYFSSTLQRSEKKKFRNREALQDRIRLERLRKAGIIEKQIADSGVCILQMLSGMIETFLGN